MLVCQMDLEEWVDADRWQSRGQRRGGQWLSGNKSAEASRSHRENVTKKSTTWLKRGAGSGGTRSRKEGWGPCKERPERQNKEAATR